MFEFTSLYSQTNNDVTVTSNDTISSSLIYHRQIPPESTYKIIKNTTGFVVSNKILEEINLHRKFDVDYLWIVNENIHILIYYFNKPNIGIEPTDY